MRELGKRESRYIHRFSEIEFEVGNKIKNEQPFINEPTQQSSLQDKLEIRVAQLEQEVEDLKEKMSQLSVLLEA